MKVFVTGVNGQLGHDVVKELVRRGHTAIGSGSKPQESVEMKVFVTGVNGQLGHDVMNELDKRGYEAVGTDVADSADYTVYVGLDITDKEAVMKTITEIKPDAVIHCAAWTAVDMAEDDDKVDKVRTVNAGGTQNIADACKAVGCKMLYLSTDYVFDGQGTEPWKPDCKDYKPLNVYPQTKLVRVIKGAVFDVAVDLRKDSDTFGKWYGVELTEENKKQFLIPKGFAHGFLVLSDTAEFCYKCDDFYHPNDEGGIAWNDPEIGIVWPKLAGEYKGTALAEGYAIDGTPLNLSGKDQKWLGINDTFKL